jgi:hypothetical protein
MASIPDLRVSESSPSLDQHSPLKRHVAVVSSLHIDVSNSEKSSGKISHDGKEEIMGSPSDNDDGPLGDKKEPLIRSGRDISEFIVDVRDDGGASLTFRSFILGTMFAGLSASLAQVRP